MEVKKKKKKEERVRNNGMEKLVCALPSFFSFIPQCFHTVGLQRAPNGNFSLGYKVLRS